VEKMYKAVPKNYRCTNCGREQYSNEYCFGCKGRSFEMLAHVEEKELREKLHNTIDVMSLNQLKALHQSLFG
jgi:hypothetical protein